MNGTLDYAGREDGRRWRFKPTPRVWAGVVVLAVIGAVATALVHVHGYRVRAASLVSLGGNRHEYADGRDVQTVIAGNGNGRIAVVVILHYGTADPRRREMAPGRVYSFNDPIQGLLSSYRVTTAYPPDPDASGLWVDGKRRAVSDRLSVIYISDKVSATDIAVGNAEEESFLNDARYLDLLAFVEKWIEPRVAKGRRGP